MIELLFIVMSTFISLTVVAHMTINYGWKLSTRFSVLFTELTESRMESLFLFANYRRMTLGYLLCSIGTLAFVYWIFASLLMVLLFIIAALVFPGFFFTMMKRKRTQAISNALPDVLAQMAGSMKAGSTFVSAVQTMVDETDGPVSQEFSLLLRELRLGTRLEDALDDLAERVQSEEMDLVVSAALIARDVGGNLSEIFNRLSMTLRKKLEMEKKIAALTAQGVLQGWVVSLLPFVILLALSYMEPEALQPLWSSVLGWVFLGVILILECVGGLMIRKIVSIDI